MDRRAERVPQRGLTVVGGSHTSVHPSPPPVHPGLLVVFLALSLSACHGCTTLRRIEPPKDAQATVEKQLIERTLRFVTPLGFAHGCAVDRGGEVLILTNRHVVDPAPLDRSSGMVGVRWSDGLGNEGLAVPSFTDDFSDLAALRVIRGQPASFPLATKEPAVGSMTWTLGYDYDTRYGALAPRPVQAAVVRVVAGHLVLERSAESGSSGSCVLDAEGHVVAINAWSIHVGLDKDTVGMVIGLWGDWLPKTEREKQ